MAEEEGKGQAPPPAKRVETPADSRKETDPQGEGRKTGGGEEQGKPDPGPPKDPVNPQGKGVSAKGEEKEPLPPRKEEKAEGDESQEANGEPILRDKLGAVGTRVEEKPPKGKNQGDKEPTPSGSGTHTEWEWRRTGGATHAEEGTRGDPPPREGFRYRGSRPIKYRRRRQAEDRYIIIYCQSQSEGEPGEP